MLMPSCGDALDVAKIIGFVGDGGMALTTAIC
jgi:hypothetical protein